MQRPLPTHVYGIVQIPPKPYPKLSTQLINDARAQNLLFRIASEGQTVLWVGTKRQVKGVISEVGERTGTPIVTERWIGGTLTNYSVIRSRLRRLEELEKIEEDPVAQLQYSKKSLSVWTGSYFFEKCVFSVVDKAKSTMHFLPLSPIL